MMNPQSQCESLQYDKEASLTFFIFHPRILLNVRALHSNMYHFFIEINFYKLVSFLLYHVLSYVGCLDVIL